MVAEMVPDRSFRGPGCSRDCRVVKAMVAGVFGRSELLLHDPESHEVYGRMSLLMQERTAVLRTGPLEIDAEIRDVRVSGRSVPLSPTEFDLLSAMARRGGGIASVMDLLHEVFGARHTSLDQSDQHLIRVSICRLRRRLGAARSLVETRFAHGYRLLMVPPGAPAPPYRPIRAGGARRGQWAIDWAACRRCRTTEFGHKARGYCQACYQACYRLGMFRAAGREP